MAEVMENTCHHKYASNAKANAGLTTGIIGTSLAGLLTLGAMSKGGGLGSILGGGDPNQGVPHGELYNERKEQQDFVELTKQYYEAQIATNNKIDKNFFDLYKMNVDNSFGLYKNHVDDSFKLYKGQRDQADMLMAKIADVEKKVDIMGAVRPYQDALINAKIDNVALVGDFNLARRTCKMITGELVLPSTPTVTGYPSYSPCNPVAPAAGA
jgi:NAD(P)H-dependent flavin oxidoreductase YrpB (nitropropane dioxygenase family)